MLNWLKKDLFRRTESGPVGWRKILLAVACVIAATAISLSRTVGAGSLNTIWIEDAKFLLNQALNVSFWRALAAPISSYYQEPARIFTEIAIQFPLSWAPGVMAIFAAAQYAMYGLVAYIASGPYLRSPWLRLLIAAPVCAIPLAYTQVNNDLVTVQFFGLYGAFWTVLWIPGTRAGKILSPLVMATVSWTAVLSIVFAPLIIARLIVDRSKNAWCLAILWASGVWLQMSETVLGESHHDEYGQQQLVLRAEELRGPGSCRGRCSESARSAGPGRTTQGNSATPLHITNVAAHDALIVGAWVVVLVVVALAATRFTDPNWTLAGVAAAVQRRHLLRRDVHQHVRCPAALRRRAGDAALHCPGRPHAAAAAGGRHACPGGRPLASRRRVRRAARGRGYAQLPCHQRPHHQPGVDQRGCQRQQRLHDAWRHGIYLCARVVVCDDPVQQGRVRYPARTGYEINVTQSFSGTRHACMG